MYTKNVLVVSGALLSAVAAVPMNKRDIVWVTHTDVVMETVQATKTVWVNPGETVTASHYGHGHHPSSSTKSSSSSEVVSTSVAEPTSSAGETTSSFSSSSSSSTPVYVAPTTSSSSSSSSTSTSSSVYVAPTTSSSTSSSVYVAPTTSSSTSSSVYVAPTTSSSTSSSVYVAPTTSSAPAPSTYSAPSSSSAASSSSAVASSTDSSSGSSYTGQATYYTPGLGSCGTTDSESDAVVALSYVNIDAGSGGASSNNNPLCNKWINIEYNGKSSKAKIVDTCPGCAENGLDLSPTVFQELADLAEGRLFGVTWSYA